jgi:hypothetical protein
MTEKPDPSDGCLIIVVECCGICGQGATNPSWETVSSHQFGRSGDSSQDQERIGGRAFRLGEPLFGVRQVVVLVSLVARKLSRKLK